jgi:hypothetical protein
MLASNHHSLDLGKSRLSNGDIIAVGTHFVLSIRGAYSGLHTQGRNKSFMAPSLEKERPVFLKTSGKQNVWKPYGAPLQLKDLRLERYGEALPGQIIEV